MLLKLITTNFFRCI